MRTKKGFRLRQLGKEYILIAESVEQINFNKMITFNASAAFLWQQTENKDFDKSTLANLLIKEYEISQEQAEKDAELVIREWTDANILE